MNHSSIPKRNSQGLSGGEPAMWSRDVSVINLQRWRLHCDYYKEVKWSSTEVLIMTFKLTCLISKTVELPAKLFLNYKDAKHCLAASKISYKKKELTRSRIISCSTSRTSNFLNKYQYFTSKGMELLKSATITIMYGSQQMVKTEKIFSID